MSGGRRVRRLAIGTAGLFALSVPHLAYAQASPSAFTTGYRYDAEQRVVGTIAPDPDGTGPIAYAAVRNTYDAQGRLTRVESGELASWQSEAVAPSAWTGFTIFRTVDYSYDADSRKTKETLTADGAVQSMTQTSYDPLDRPVCVAVRMDPTVWSSQTDACVPQTTGANGPDRITRTLYTPQGWVDRIQKAFGTGLQQDYATYTYMATGQVASVTDANQNLATYGYDALYRLTQWNFPSPTQPGTINPTDYEAYTYDNNGNRKTLRKRDGSTLTYDYDALNRMVDKMVPDGGGLVPAMTRDVYYGYDNRGLMTSATFDSVGGAGITNAFDNAGRLSSSTNSLIPGSKTLIYSYDQDSNRTRITHPDGVSYDTTYDGLDRSTAVWWTGGAYTSQGTLAYTNRPASSTVYTYDGSLRLTHIGQHFASSANNLEQGFGYNNASQLTSETRDNDAFAFGGEYSVNRAYAVNGLNQYNAAGPDTLTYDGNGNLNADTVNGATTNYTYDRENRLVWASGPTTTAIYYDPLGRLSMTNTSAGNHYFLYDGDNLAAEYDGSGNLTKRYVFGTGTDEPLVEATGATLDCSTAKFLHANQQGSIIAEVDCSGNITAHNTYDEYGINGSANTGRFQYTGQMWMPEIGLYYYKARMYSPTLGRFMQTDPIGYKDQINLYAYVGDDPVDGRDPTGFYTCSADTQQCKNIEAAWRLTKNEARTYELGSSERRLLNGVLQSLGAPGQTNGVTVGVGNLDPGTLGQTEETSKGINVTLDFNQINAAAKKEGTSGLNLGAVVLGHEGFHVAMREAGVQLGNEARHYYDEEWRAYATGAVVAGGLHLELQRLPVWGQRDFTSSLESAATRGCIGDAAGARKNGYELYGGCGPGE